MDDVFKATHMVSDVLLDEDEQHTITGVTQIIDLQGVTGAHALQMTPSLVKKAMTIWQDGYPMRPKGLHYINTPPSFETVFSIFRSFMKEKMRKRVQIHGNSLESLHKHISKEVLPIEYGG
ncbi:UNVERIFIED_CONTAM: hypothetical protein GTU68_002396, partial [Idotea baltica]|nr:hypothetical protein [Idotea baltica]